MAKDELPDWLYGGGERKGRQADRRRDVSDGPVGPGGIDFDHGLPQAPPPEPAARPPGPVPACPYCGGMEFQVRGYRLPTTGLFGLPRVLEARTCGGCGRIEWFEKGRNP